MIKSVAGAISPLLGKLLRHGRDVHPAWVNVVTAALALKSFRGQVTRAEVMLESREGFWVRD
jgi:hypothetical protein